MRIKDKNSKLSSGGNNNSSITIHGCAESGDLTELQRLLGNNPSLLNERSILMIQTPLHMGASLNRVEIIKYLLEWTGAGNVELEAKNVYGETSLHLAAKNGCNEALMMLLKHGANIEARTKNLMTPLHLAVGYALRSGDNSTVKILSEHCADLSARDDEGMIPHNYLPTGISNDELSRLLEENVPQQTNGHQKVLQQSNSSWSGKQNGEEMGDYESRIQEKLDDFDYELSKIVGLVELKEQLRRWSKGILLDEKRRAMGINLGPRKPPHMAFLGNPGTGKTTVARILGKLLHSIGVLSSDNVIEVQKRILWGNTLAKPDPRLEKEEAMGGILFVDEAYQLAPKDNVVNYVDYGKEALEEIMSVLEDGGLLVVFAGYTDKMKRVFDANEGFRRRVTHSFEFDDFTCKDLAEMLIIKMSKQDQKSRLYGFKLHPSCTFDAVLSVIERCSTEDLRKGMNGGLVDVMLNNARENLDSRLNFNAKGDELLTITLADLEAGLKQLSQSSGNLHDEKKKQDDGQGSVQKRILDYARKKSGIPTHISKLS